MATALRALVVSHRGWSRHDRDRHAIRRAWQEFFSDWDVLLCPSTATVALPHDERPPEQRTITVNGEEQTAMHQVTWAALATVASLPATVFPAGVSADGLPIGLQLVGPELHDLTTIEVARLLGEHGYRFAPPPTA